MYIQTNLKNPDIIPAKTTSSFLYYTLKDQTRICVADSVVYKTGTVWQVMSDEKKNNYENSFPEVFGYTTGNAET